MTEKPEDDGLLETRFGLVAIRKGLITADHLVKALEIQVLEEIEFGLHRRIGEILLEQSVMSTDQLGEVLEDLSRGTHI